MYTSKYSLEIIRKREKYNLKKYNFINFSTEPNFLYLKMQGFEAEERHSG